MAPAVVEPEFVLEPVQFAEQLRLPPGVAPADRPRGTVGNLLKFLFDFGTAPFQIAALF